MELRADGSASLRDDRVWLVLVADNFVCESVVEFFHWADLIDIAHDARALTRALGATSPEGRGTLFKDYCAVVMQQDLFSQVGSHGFCQDHHFQIFALASEVGDRVAMGHRGGGLRDYRACVEFFSYIVGGCAD